VTDELQLLQLIAKGDKIAFKELYALYSNKVYATALHYLQNINDAEEVTQDVFVSIFKNAISFKGNSSVSTWVYRIAVNTSLNYIKKKTKSPNFSLEEYNKEIPNFEHPGVVEENKENARRMYQAINTLPETQKTAFILGFIEEKPRQEIADIMETSLKAVESLLQRAKASLKIKLEEINPNRRKL
jgi:RNA polymerase sigma-70 factor (ECF subfamily)